MSSHPTNATFGDLLDWGRTPVRNPNPFFLLEGLFCHLDAFEHVQIHSSETDLISKTAVL